MDMKEARDNVIARARDLRKAGTDNIAEWFALCGALDKLAEVEEQWDRLDETFGRM